MSSEEKKPNSPKKNLLNALDGKNLPSSQINKDEEKSDNNQLIKPIPINPKLIKNQKSDATTHGNSSVTLNHINVDPNMPIIYPPYHYPITPQNNSSFEDSNINFIKQKNSKNEEKIDANNTFQKDKLCCSCTKTKCIKKYCECFANKKFCKDCKCQDCLNKLELNNYNSNSFLNENDIIICTCTKSNCNKKYCECYKAGVKCNEKCRCLNCMNNISPNQNILNNSINSDNNIKNPEDKKINEGMGLEEKKPISRKSSNSGNINDKFKIQRISVYINKNQTYINVEKFSKEEMNLLCKKRNHD